MKKRIRIFLSTVTAVALILAAGLTVFYFQTTAQDYPFENLFRQGFAGYTNEDGEVPAAKYVSSEAISVKGGETV